MPIILNDDVGEIIDQAMGGLWLLNRQWCHIGLYCPALKKIGSELKIIEVWRDETYISEMVKDLQKFDDLVKENIEKIKQSKRFFKIAA